MVRKPNMSKLGRIAFGLRVTDRDDPETPRDEDICSIEMSTYRNMAVTPVTAPLKPDLPGQTINT